MNLPTATFIQEKLTPANQNTGNKFQNPYGHAICVESEESGVRSNAIQHPPNRHQL